MWVICWSGFGVYGPAKTLGRIEPFWLVPSWMLETTSSVYCCVLNLFLFFARTSSFPNLLFGCSPDGHRQWIQQIFQGIVFVWFRPLVLSWKCNIIVWLRDILSWAKLVGTTVVLQSELKAARTHTHTHVRSEPRVPAGLEWRQNRAEQIRGSVLNLPY